MGRLVQPQKKFEMWLRTDERCQFPCLVISVNYVMESRKHVKYWQNIRDIYNYLQHLYSAHSGDIQADRQLPSSSIPSASYSG